MDRPRSPDSEITVQKGQVRTESSPVDGQEHSLPATAHHKQQVGRISPDLQLEFKSTQLIKDSQKESNYERTESSPVDTERSASHVDWVVAIPMMHRPVTPDSEINAIMQNTPAATGTSSSPIDQSFDSKPTSTDEASRVSPDLSIPFECKNVLPETATAPASQGNEQTRQSYDLYLATLPKFHQAQQKQAKPVDAQSRLVTYDSYIAVMPSFQAPTKPNQPMADRSDNYQSYLAMVPHFAASAAGIESTQDRPLNYETYLSLIPSFKPAAKQAEPAKPKYDRSAAEKSYQMYLLTLPKYKETQFAKSDSVDQQSRLVTYDSYLSIMPSFKTQIQSTEQPDRAQAYESYLSMIPHFAAQAGHKLNKDSDALSYDAYVKLLPSFKPPEMSRADKVANAYSGYLSTMPSMTSKAPTSTSKPDPKAAEEAYALYLCTLPQYKKITKADKQTPTKAADRMISYENYMAMLPSFNAPAAQKSEAAPTRDQSYDSYLAMIPHFKAQTKDSAPTQPLSYDDYVLLMPQFKSAKPKDNSDQYASYLCTLPSFSKTETSSKADPQKAAEAYKLYLATLPTYKPTVTEDKSRVVTYDSYLSVMPHFKAPSPAAPDTRADNYDAYMAMIPHFKANKDKANDEPMPYDDYIKLMPTFNSPTKEGETKADTADVYASYLCTIPSFKQQSTPTGSKPDPEAAAKSYQLYLSTLPQFKGARYDRMVTYDSYLSVMPSFKSADKASDSESSRDAAYNSYMAMIPHFKREDTLTEASDEPLSYDDYLLLMPQFTKPSLTSQPTPDKEHTVAQAYGAYLSTLPQFNTPSSIKEETEPEQIVSGYEAYLLTMPSMNQGSASPSVLSTDVSSAKQIVSDVLESATRRTPTSDANHNQKAATSASAPSQTPTTTSSKQIVSGVDKDGHALIGGVCDSCSVTIDVPQAANNNTSQTTPIATTVTVQQKKTVLNDKSTIQSTTEPKVMASPTHDRHVVGGVDSDGQPLLQAISTPPPTPTKTSQVLSAVNRDNVPIQGGISQPLDHVEQHLTGTTQSPPSNKTTASLQMSKPSSDPKDSQKPTDTSLDSNKNIQSMTTAVKEAAETKKQEVSELFTQTKVNKSESAAPKDDSAEESWFADKIESAKDVLESGADKIGNVAEGLKEKVASVTSPTKQTDAKKTEAKKDDYSDVNWFEGTTQSAADALALGATKVGDKIESATSAMQDTVSKVTSPTKSAETGGQTPSKGKNDDYPKDNWFDNKIKEAKDVLESGADKVEDTIEAAASAVKDKASPTSSPAKPSQPEKKDDYPKDNWFADKIESAKDSIESSAEKVGEKFGIAAAALQEKVTSPTKSADQVANKPNKEEVQKDDYPKDNWFADKIESAKDTIESSAEKVGEKIGSATSAVQEKVTELTSPTKPEAKTAESDSKKAESKTDAYTSESWYADKIKSAKTTVEDQFAAIVPNKSSEKSPASPKAEPTKPETTIQYPSDGWLEQKVDSAKSVLESTMDKANETVTDLLTSPNEDKKPAIITTTNTYVQNAPSPPIKEPASPLLQLPGPVTPSNTPERELSEDAHAKAHKGIVGTVTEKASYLAHNGVDKLEKGGKHIVESVNLTMERNTETVKDTGKKFVESVNLKFEKLTNDDGKKEEQPPSELKGLQPFPTEDKQLSHASFERTPLSAQVPTPPATSPPGDTPKAVSEQQQMAHIDDEADTGAGLTSEMRQSQTWPRGHTAVNMDDTPKLARPASDGQMQTANPSALKRLRERIRNICVIL